MSADKIMSPSSVPAAKVTEVNKPQVKDTKLVSTGLSQREAVYQEIMRVLKDDKVNFDGATQVKAHLNEARMKKVSEAIALGFKAGKIQLKQTPGNQKKLSEPSLLNAYVSGLVNNWIRRDSRLNGKPATKS
jgi:hypothetical protein